MQQTFSLYSGYSALKAETASSLSIYAVDIGPFLEELDKFMPVPKTDLHRGSCATNRFRYAVERKLEVPDFIPMEPRIDSLKFDKALTPCPYDLAIAANKRN